MNTSRWKSESGRWKCEMKFFVFIIIIIIIININSCLDSVTWRSLKSGFWPKNGSYPQKSPKMTFSPLIIWAKGPFFFEQLFSVVARTWLVTKSDRLFFGPKFRFLAQKSDFCHTTPIFVDDPFLALDMTVNFPPWKRFFDFPLRSYSCFVKKSGWPAKKSSPFPLWGYRLPLTALALSTRRPFGPAWAG